MNLKKADIARNFSDSFQARIMAFDMADLECEMIFSSQTEKLIRLIELERDGFFNERMNASLQHLFGNPIMSRSRGCHADRFYFSQQLAVIRIKGDMELAGAFCFRRIEVAKTDKVCLFKAMVDPSMFFP